MRGKSEYPTRHGDQHEHGGSDELRVHWESVGNGGPGAATAEWPTYHNLVLLNDFDTPFANSGYSLVTDFTATLGGGYLQSTADASYLTWPVRLGPKNSVWGVNLTYHRLSDGGILSFGWGSADENEYGEGRFSLNADVTFVEHPTTQTTYAGSPSKNFNNPNLSEIRLKGDDGAMVTAIGSADPDVGAARQFNGGAGFYVFRLKVTGKEGSSSGYKTQLVAVSLRRLSG